MRVAHLLRKLDPAAWSGTETAIHRLLDGLRGQGIDPVVYCPRLAQKELEDPLVRSGFEVQRFRAFVPVLGLAEERRRQLIAVGGNLMSFDLITGLLRGKDLSVIHAHTLGRIGGIALTVAKRRRVPFVVTIHGGVLDLPEKIRRSFNAPVDIGWEWGKLFGLLFQAHRLFCDADAILTCNLREAELLREKMPGKLILVQPHGIPVDVYRQDHRQAALLAFPQIGDRQVLLSLGRIDPIKNQSWLVEQLPAILQKHPRAFLVLAGPCTDEPYGRELGQKLNLAGVQDRVLLTGGLPADDPRLIGLLQSAKALILPSLSETFGLVILEAWAAGAMVISARASGPAALVRNGENGWLFDLDQPQVFHQTLDWTLAHPESAKEMVSRGTKIAEQYNVQTLAGRLRNLYETLIQEKKCAT